MPFKSRKQFYYLMREHPDIWKEWVAKYGVRGLGVGSKSKWMNINPQEYLDRSFKSREQFFWMRKNKSAEWLKILEEQGLPESLGLGSADKWISRGFEAEVFEAYKPPQAAVNNAKRGLKLREKWGRGGLSPAEAKKQGIDSGVTRAKKISSGSVSRHDVRRMSAFNRHRKNYNPSKKKPDGGPTAGTIAWLLWGGTSGVDWAKKLSATMNAESWSAEEIKTNLPQHKVKTIQAGVEIITKDLRKPQIDMFNENFLRGQLKSYQDFLNGIKITSGELVLEEISWILSPKAEELGERAYQANNEEMEHYYMGMIYGYDFILDLFGEFPADFQREMAAESIDIDIDFEDATLTRKEVKMAMWYPLIVGFMGGTLANIASNYFTVYYLKKRDII
jgi:hypothetical protein